MYTMDCLILVLIGFAQQTTRLHTVVGIAYESLRLSAALFYLDQLFSSLQLFFINNIVVRGMHFIIHSIALFMFIVLSYCRSLKGIPLSICKYFSLVPLIAALG